MTFKSNHEGSPDAARARELQGVEERVRAAEQQRERQGRLWLHDLISASANGYDVEIDTSFAPHICRVEKPSTTTSRQLSHVERLGDHHFYIKAGNTPCIMINIQDDQIRADVRAVAEDIFGITRLVFQETDDIGRKYCMLAYRASEDFSTDADGCELVTRQTLASRGCDDFKNEVFPIKVLGEGRMFLASSTHPGGGNGASPPRYESLAPFAVPRIVPDIDPNTGAGMTITPIPPPGSVRWADLPAITEAMIDQFFEQVVDCLPLGLRVMNPRHTEWSANQKAPATQEAIADALRPNGGIPIDRFTPPSYVYGIGFQIFTATNGQQYGLEAWLKWVASGGDAMPGAGYGFISDWRHRHTLENAWDHQFGRSTDRIGFDSIFHEAKLRGWTPGKLSAVDGELPIWDDEADADRTPRAWLVAGLVPQSAHVLLVGLPNVGKSFVAMDTCLHIASGRPWMGKPVTQGAVVYIAAEGAEGLKLRERAFANAYGIDVKALPFDIIPAAINLGNAGSGDVEKIVAAIRKIEAKRDQPVRLIVIDTLAATLAGGDENGVGMNCFLNHVRRLIGGTSATVLTVCHPSKSGNGTDPRGHGSLLGDADASLVVRSDARGRKTLLVSKLRDGEKGAFIDFHIEVVDLGSDASGAPATSGVIRAGHKAGAAKAGGHGQSDGDGHVDSDGDGQPVASALSKGLQRTLACLASAPDADTEALSSGLVPEGARAVAMADWQEAAIDPTKNIDSERRKHDRHVRRLMELRAVAIDSGVAWAL